MQDLRWLNRSWYERWYEAIFTSRGRVSWRLRTTMRIIFAFAFIVAAWMISVALLCSGRPWHIANDSYGMSDCHHSSRIPLLLSLAWTPFPGTPAVPYDNSVRWILVDICIIYFFMRTELSTVRHTSRHLLLLRSPRRSALSSLTEVRHIL